MCPSERESRQGRSGVSHREPINQYGQHEACDVPVRVPFDGLRWHKRLAVGIRGAAEFLWSGTIERVLSLDGPPFLRLLEMVPQ
jgi:hypothetical protein